MGEDYERKIIIASNIIVQSLERTPLPLVEEFLESPGHAGSPGQPLSRSNHD
jgi:hypothetical protein